MQLEGGKRVVGNENDIRKMRRDRTVEYRTEGETRFTDPTARPIERGGLEDQIAGVAIGVAAGEEEAADLAGRIEEGHRDQVVPILADKDPPAAGTAATPHGPPAVVIEPLAGVERLWKKQLVDLRLGGFPDQAN